MTPRPAPSLAELAAQHLRGHGPSQICGGPDRCTSARYLALIAAQQADLARLELRRARLYKRLKHMAELEHWVMESHVDPFSRCRFIGCSEARWSLRMGGPIR